MNAENLKKQNGVYIPEGIIQDTTFEKLYLSVRRREQRVFSNSEIINLPEISAGHDHFYEWSIRNKSCKRLIKYLTEKNRFLKILEIGCGNGWLSHKLAEIPQTEVIGLDINFTELQQAANVFKNSNLHFVYGDLRQNILSNMQFDIIIFAASIQYFSSTNEIINAALKILSFKGEINIIDSFLYNKTDVETVKQKCREYYEHNGFPEMANYFFHPLLIDMYRFNCTEMKQKTSLFEKLFFKKPIFPWICIRHF